MSRPRSLPQLSLDCHFYDGRLGDQMTLFDQWLDTMYERHHEEYLEPQPALFWFMDQPQLTQTAKTMIQVINRTRADNVVWINGQRWDTFILFSPLQWICSRYPDLLPVINEQLEDMKSGSCPQGRLYRILQVCISVDVQ